MKKYPQKLSVLIFLIASVPLFPLNPYTNLEKYSDTTKFSVMVAPSTILPDLKFGKMDFPVDEMGNDNEGVLYENRAAEYVKVGTVENLDGYVPEAPYSEYFFVDGDEVVFRAHCAGALTSPNAYPRCEWRQRINGEDIFWDFEDQHFLSATFSVTNLPNLKQEVCMLQVKGSNDRNTSNTEEVFRLEYRDNSDQQVHVTINEDETIKDIIPYKLNEVFNAKIYINNKQVKIELKNISTGDTWSKEYTSNYDYGYFKAGCYTQSSIWEGKNGVGSEAPDAYGEVRFSKLSLTDDDTPPVETNGDDIWLEAECATIGSGWEKVLDSNASAGAYVVAKAGNESKDAPPTSTNSHVRFTVEGNLAVDKNWKLKARVRALNDSDDSFWVRINDAAWINWNGNVKTGSQYKWQTLRGEGSEDFYQFSLKNGLNTIDFAYRENGARLDKILLTTQNTIVFTGEQTNATNCTDGETGTDCPELITHTNKPLTAGTYQATNITSKGIITATNTVIYKAANNIQLTNGFHAQQNSNFSALIANCEAAPPASTNITIDGSFDDWAALATVSTNGSNGLNFLKVYNDCEAIYIYADGNFDTNFQLFIDSDFNATGTNEFAGFVYPATGMNFMMENAYPYDYTGSGTDWLWNQTSLTTEPFEISGNKLEMRIPKNIIPSLGSTINVGFVVLDNDWTISGKLPSGDAGAAYSLTPCDDLKEVPYTRLKPTKSNESPLEKIIHFNVFPNPFKDAVTIALDVKKSGNYSLAVYDMLGKVVTQPLTEKWLDKGHHQVNVQLHSANSLYVVQLSNSDNVSSQKIITQIRK